jgi:Cu/Ag efflux protein CusF
MADQATTPATKEDRGYTGRVVTVDSQERVLRVKGLVFSKTFSLGDSCTFALLDPPEGTLGDVRPGQKVTVRYEDVAGVLVADRVEQRALRYEGTVKQVDPKNQVLTVKHRMANKTFHLAEGCQVVLRDGKSGTLAVVQPGEHVTVTYELPNNQPTARRIDQTSARFTGSLTAIDLNTRTVKAKSLSGSKKFNLADECAIVVNGKLGGRMLDLKPGDKLTFSYDEVDGVNIVNRIATAEGSKEHVAASSE